MSGKSKTTEKSDATATTTLDPRYASLIYGNAARAQGLADQPYQPYGGEKVAGFTPDQVESQGILGDIARNNTGADTLSAAITAAKNAAGYAPTTVTPTGAAAGQVDRSAVQNVTGQSITDLDLSKYMDPYEQSVVDATSNDLNMQRQREQLQNTMEATKAGAWRGNALGVTNALTNEASDRTLASTVAALRSAGYGQALGAATSDLNRRFAADQGNQGVDLSVATTNAGNTNTTNLANQEAALRAAQGNQSAGLLGAQQSATSAGLLGNLSNEELNQQAERGSILGAVGDAQQAQQQAALDWAYQNGYLNKMDYDERRQQLLNQSLGLVPQTGTTATSGTSTTTTKKSPGLLDILQVMASAGQAAAQAGMGAG